MPLLEDLDQLEREKKIAQVPFNYSATWDGANAIVAGTGGIPQNIQIQADAHFVVRYVAIMSYISAVSLPIMPNTGMAALTIAFLDQGSSRNLQDSPQPIQNICGGVAATGGNGSLPFIWPMPWLVKASAQIQITLGNLSLVTFPRVQVSLIGFKVFPFTGVLGVGGV